MNWLRIVNLSEIQKAAEEIGKRFHPQKIFLFGSYAYGKPTKDSDVDFLVAMNTDLRNPRQAAKILQEVNFEFPVDILVRKPEEIQKRLAMGDQFIQEITTKGKILYETLDERMD